MPRKLSMPPDELRAYVKQWAGIKTLHEMHKETGVNRLTILNYASDLGLSVEIESKRLRRERVKQTILELHATHTTWEISRILQIPQGTVAYRGWEMGLTFKRNNAKQRIAMESSKEKYFNPHHYENWLVY